MHFGTMFSAQVEDAGGFVTVTDISINKVTSGTPCFAGIVFVDDGSIEDQGVDNVTFAQIHTGEWWSDEPETSVGDDYQVRCQSIDSGVTFNVQPAVVGTYANMGTTGVQMWNINRTPKQGIGVVTNTSTFQIRLKASPFTVLDTFEVILRCERTA